MDGFQVSHFAHHDDIRIFPQGATQGDFYSTTLGPYDRWAIEYGYKPLPGGTEGEVGELKKIAAKVQQEGSGSGSGSGDPAGSGSGAPTANGSDEAAGSGSGNSAPAPREGSGASPAKSIAAQVASMQGPPKPNLAALLRALREKQAPAAKPSRGKAGARTGATRADGWVDIEGGIGTVFSYASLVTREFPNDVIMVEGEIERPYWFDKNARLFQLGDKHPTPGRVVGQANRAIRGFAA